MNTWHQALNPTMTANLWATHPTLWKCVSDRPNEFASCMSFATEAEARAYAERTGAVY